MKNKICQSWIIVGCDVINCDQQLYTVGHSVGWSTKNSPLFGSHSFCPRRLKFGGQVCVKACVHANWLKVGVAMVCHKKGSELLNGFMKHG